MGRYSHYATGDAELEELTSKLPRNENTTFNLENIRNAANARFEEAAKETDCKIVTVFLNERLFIHGQSVMLFWVKSRYR